MSALPPYLRAKATHLPEGHDDTLDPAEAPTDAARRTVAPSTWPKVSTARGPLGPPDAPAGPAGVDPLARGLAPFSWPSSHVSDFVGDLDPDLALWPGILLTRWPFTGPPTTGVWPLGWLGVDNTATVWVCTVGGQPGTWIAIGGTGGSGVAGVYNVKNYGATGNGTTDDTAAITAAINAANAAGGGGIYYPPGTYAVSAPLQYYNNTYWFGAGMGVSTIRLTVDLWAGGTNRAAHFITPSGGMSHSGATSIRDLGIRGPAPVGSYGQAGNKTVGLQTASHCTYYNLFIQQFFAGLEVVSDHETFFNVNSNANYYNVDFAGSLGTGQIFGPGGNQSFYSCKFDGPLLASVHIESPNAMIGTNMSQVHTGFGPVAFFVTNLQNTTTPWDANGNPVYAGGATPSSTPFYANTWEEIHMEFCGNIGILDIDPQGGYTMRGCTLTRINMSWGSGSNAGTPSTLPPLDNPQYQRAWSMILKSTTPDTVLTANTQGMVTGTTGFLKILPGNYGQGPTVNWYNGLYSNFFGSGTDWSALDGLGMVINMLAAPSWNGTVWSMPTNAVINAGDLVEIVLVGGAVQAYVQRATGTKPVLGVALTPTPGAGQVAYTAVLTGGEMNAVNAAVGSIPIGALLYCSTTTPYMVDNTSTTNALVGIAMAPGAASTVRAKIQPKLG